MSHTFRGSNVTIIHDGDYRGDACLRVAPYFASIEGIIVSSKVPYVEIEVPMSDLFDFVAEAVRSERIGVIEQQSTAEILGLPEKKEP